MQTSTVSATLSSCRQYLPSRRALVIGSLFVAAYVLLGLGARSYLVRPFGITPWNPTAGLALALLLVYGVRYWPALAVATFAVNLVVRGWPAAPYLQLLIPVAITAGYAGMAALLLGPLRFRLHFDRMRDLMSLVVVSGVGTLLIAMVVASVFQANNLIPPDQFQFTLRRAWIGHLLGVVINTPLLLMLHRWSRTGADLRRWATPEFMVQWSAVLLVFWIIFGVAPGDPYKLFYLLFLPLIWIAMRQALAGTVLTVAVMQIGLIVSIMNTDNRGMVVTEFQFLMLALAVTGLFLGMAVSERRDASRALDDSESRLRAIVTTAPDSIVTVDNEGIIMAANPATERMFGYPAGLLAGRPVTTLLPGFGVARERRDTHECSGVRRDGTSFPAELAVGSAGDGSGAMTIAVVRDASHRKEIERQLGEKQEELNRSARLAAAGEMAAALAHELHQPLSAIRNYARASQVMASEGQNHELMCRLESEAARAARVVQRLRDFFRSGESRLEPISAGALIEAALEPMCDEAARQRATLEVEVARPDIVVLIDRVQIETVIHCLVNNALEALTTGSGDRRVIRVSADEAPGGWLRCSVADSGSGISLEIANRLFEPFTTNKATGIGMGLAMSRSMISAHGGEMWAEARAGGGTCMHFTIPVADMPRVDDVDEVNGAN